MEKIWRSIEEKEEQNRNSAAHINQPEKNGESLVELFDDKTLGAHSSRRDFLKLFGFSIASAAIAASCEQPVRKAIPYLIRPEALWMPQVWCPPFDGYLRPLQCAGPLRPRASDGKSEAVM